MIQTIACICFMVYAILNDMFSWEQLPNHALLAMICWIVLAGKMDEKLRRK